MDTIDPDSISAELLERDDETETARSVPPVVAVVVAHDAGKWFEEGLAALGAQDYPSLSVLVLDNQSETDPTDRVAQALPGAFVRRCTLDGGFAATANEVLTVVEGAVFLLFCHDDVVLDPESIRLLVEEAYRSNAGIVGPKLVDRHNPDVLLEVGMSIDHYGEPYSGIEPDEVDQEQHDGVRDVFYVSHATMLVRADLFHELGGFDVSTSPGADDIDLCWRARLAGARVIVAPSARVRHGRATEQDDRQAAERERRARSLRGRPARVLRDQTRSRIRVIVKAYSALALLWVLPVAYTLNLFESLALLLTGNVARARAVVAGGVSAFAHPGELRRARSSTQRMRRVDDGDVRDLMIRGSARFRRFMLERVHAGERLADVSTRTRARMDEVSRRARQLPALFAVVIAVLLLFGSRSLLAGHVPEVGSFQAWPGVATAWSTFMGPWRTSMMGSATPASPAFALIATFGAALLGHTGLAQSLVIGGALPIGAFGAYRLLRGFSASTLPGIAAAAAYAANPIARNAIWHGDLGPLVCFALAPYFLGVFIRSTDPSGRTSGRSGAEIIAVRSRVHVGCSIALLVALIASVWPPAVLFAPAIALAFCLALPFTGGLRQAGVALAGALAGSALGLVLLAPWSFSLFGADASTLGAQPRDSLSLEAILHFHTGRAGAGFTPWGIVAAAVVPLAIATGPRLAWATRAWILAALSFAVAWVPGRISAGATVPSPDGILVAAAIGLAFAAGLGVAAVLDDLRRFHFGWRQIMMIVAFAGLAFALVGLSADTLSGQYGLKSTDWPGTYSWMGEIAPPGGFRVLWIGDPTVLPADAKVVGRVGFALTREGPGDARVSWAAPEHRADEILAGMIASAASGSTVRLGHLLAPAGVRYIAFVSRAAPTSGAHGRDETAIANALGRQLDLTLSRVDDSGVVYDNDAWIPVHAELAPGNVAVRVDGTDPQAAAIRSEPDGVAGVSVNAGATSAIGPGTLLWSEAANRHWVASVNGRSVPRRDAFGWTNAYALDGAGVVHVRYSGSSLVAALRVLEIGLWIALFALWFVTRSRRDDVRQSDAGASRRVAPASETDADRVESPVSA